MSKNIIQSIVIILGILIIFAFLAIIYGMYSKLSTSVENFSDSKIIFSSNLRNQEKIKNIEVLDKNNLLILIEGDNVIRGAIYDIQNNQIIRFIER